MANQHSFDSSWTLFLDRDGVINERKENDYIKNWKEFSFIKGVPRIMENLADTFGHILIVTNQAGIGKNLMTEAELHEVHRMMLKTIDLMDGRIDKIYYAPEMPDAKASTRKPHAAMALQAQKDYPEIDFSKSLMVGDSLSDMLFGKNLGMVTVLIEGKGDDFSGVSPDYTFKSLPEFVRGLGMGGVELEEEEIEEEGIEEDETGGGTLEDETLDD